ncbi:TPA: hypothetical protein ACGI14_001840 [Corynebacterium striatum]|uniref:hypothetical protein n=1 Tax=Corynebacterium striatum TaxID=43770 RepID=UPI0014198299|nr:hypothetical protein [Corynebacterium striatum]NHX52937.1 hypothetical protein [Corynebacterium striatum]NHY37549.1 hypothetical protein [Corynebacterium striatum]HAT1133796.1 hypothetical protein [Corynebacterium striatum]HAT1158520.1 hypothetical protein [Corynebacterium striatum]HAT1161248.1 hypothetical protein [Corynebacterium striatum]
MTNTIEVPISLINAGDIDAIRDLLPQENLFGRWAEHPTLGRGIIISEHPDQENFVKFVNGKSWSGVTLDDLTLDPAELTTVEDFETAPEGTVVAEPTGNAYQKVLYYWESMNDSHRSEEMAVSGPWKILRYGWGE